MKLGEIPTWCDRKQWICGASNISGWSERVMVGTLENDDMASGK